MGSVQDRYIDYEVRLQILEALAKDINNKMNLALSLLTGSLLIPIALKYLGY